MVTFTAEMIEGVSRYLERAGRPIPKTHAVDGAYRELGLCKDRVRAILAELVAEGYVAVEPDRRTQWHRSVKPYRAELDPPAYARSMDRENTMGHDPEPTRDDLDRISDELTLVEALLADLLGEDHPYSRAVAASNARLRALEARLA